MAVWPIMASTKQNIKPCDDVFIVPVLLPMENVTSFKSVSIFTSSRLILPGIPLDGSSAVAGIPPFRGYFIPITYHVVDDNVITIHPLNNASIGLGKTMTSFISYHCRNNFEI